MSYELLFFGILAPDFRASLRAMAIACFRLLTLCPLPDFNVPSWCSFMTLWILVLPLVVLEVLCASITVSFISIFKSPMQRCCHFPPAHCGRSNARTLQMLGFPGVYERRRHHDHPAYPAVGSGAGHCSGVALQQGLGILPQWNSRDNSCHFDRLASAGSGSIFAGPVNGDCSLMKISNDDKQGSGMEKRTSKEQTRQNRPPRNTPPGPPKSGNEKNRSTSPTQGHKSAERRHSGTNLPGVAVDEEKSELEQYEETE